MNDRDSAFDEIAAQNPELATTWYEALEETSPTPEQVTIITQHAIACIKELFYVVHQTRARQLVVVVTPPINFNVPLYWILEVFNTTIEYGYELGRIPDTFNVVAFIGESGGLFIAVELRQ